MQDLMFRLFRRFGSELLFWSSLELLLLLHDDLIFLARLTDLRIKSPLCRTNLLALPLLLVLVDPLGRRHASGFHPSSNDKMELACNVIRYYTKADLLSVRYDSSTICVNGASTSCNNLEDASQYLACWEMANIWASSLPTCRKSSSSHLRATIILIRSSSVVKVSVRFWMDLRVKSLSTFCLLLNVNDPLFQVFKAIPVRYVEAEDGAFGSQVKVVPKVGVLVAPRGVPVGFGWIDKCMFFYTYITVFLLTKSEVWSFYHWRLWLWSESRWQW